MNESPVDEVQDAEDAAELAELGAELKLDDMTMARAYASKMGNLTRERLLQAILESARLQGIWTRAGSAWRNRPALKSVGAIYGQFRDIVKDEALDQERVEMARYELEPDADRHYGPECAREALAVTLKKLAELGMGEYLEYLGHFCGD